MRGDLQVIWTDDAPSSFQRGPDPPVDGRGVGVEVHAPYLRQEDVEPSMISLPLLALLRAVAKLGDRHRAHAEVGDDSWI